MDDKTIITDYQHIKSVNNLWCRLFYNFQHSRSFFLL